MRAAPIAACLALLAAAPAPAGGLHWHEGGFEAARAEASRQGKLLLVDCWADWCRFCHVMDDEVWSDPDLARALAREVVAVKVEVDVAHGRGLPFAERYEISGLPVVLLIDPETGEVEQRLEGMQHGPALLAALDRALGPPPAALPEDAPPERLVRLAARLIRADRRDLARTALQRALERDADCARDAADDAALLLARLDPVGGIATLAAVAPRCAGADAERALWERWTDALAGAGDREALGAQLEARARRFPRDGEALLAWASWLAGSGRAEEAVGAARRAAELMPGETRPLVLIADTLYAEGKIDAALAELERAIAIDPHDPELRKRRVRFKLARRDRGS